MKVRVVALAGLLSALFFSSATSEDLTCLKSEENAVVGPASWYDDLCAQARIALDRRDQHIEQLKTVDQIRARQRTLREFLVGQLGGFPQRTPLNAQVAGTIRAQGYRIEKVLFESQPQHHVTGNLYIPDGPGPFPAVLVSSGHSRTGKTADYNQRYGIIMAQHGMVALCFDPIGQGERSQVLTEGGQPKFEATTLEHFMVGVGSILVGRNTATYRVWDAMRAIDYLETRQEVDAQRIGMVGCSGGGTLTSYVMALDDRIRCAAPSCYLTTFRALVDTIGPQDAEQNIYAQLAFGLDQPDYVLMRAPQPTLISSTTEDFFDIRGSWDNLRQNKRIYTRLGAPERIDLVEAEGKHGVQPANLAATAQWMQRWLVGKDAPVPVREFAEFKTLPESDLLCTPKGQVLLLPQARSVFDLNNARQQELAQVRKAAWARLTQAERLARVRSTIGVSGEAIQPKPKSNKAGKVERNGYHIDKLVIHTHSKVPLPALTFHPKDPSDAAYVFLNDNGKQSHAGPGEAIEQLVKQGHVVVSVDLRGQGETASGKVDARLGDWRSFYLAYLLEQSVVGALAEDVLATIHWVANYQSEKPREVHVRASGCSAIAALHAAALRPDLFTSLELSGVPRDWSTVVGQPELATYLTSTVHGALTQYDLPDLVELVGVDKVRFQGETP